MRASSLFTFSLLLHSRKVPAAEAGWNPKYSGNGGEWLSLRLINDDLSTTDVIWEKVTISETVVAYLKVILLSVSWRRGKPWEISIRTVINPAEVQTGCLPNTSQERHGPTTLSDKGDEQNNFDNLSVNEPQLLRKSFVTLLRNLGSWRHVFTATTLSSWSDN
jgi:hypothetical protein